MADSEASRTTFVDMEYASADHPSPERGGWPSEARPDGVFFISSPHPARLRAPPSPANGGRICSQCSVTTEMTTFCRIAVKSLGSDARGADDLRPDFALGSDLRHHL